MTQFDSTAFSYPSDMVTLGQMRAFDPSMLSREAIEKNKCTCVDALAMLWWEQILAEKAYFGALGESDPHRPSNRDEIIETLSRAYQEYGISTGPQQSMQLIRQIEAGATAQARSTQGPSASR